MVVLAGIVIVCAEMFLDLQSSWNLQYADPFLQVKEHNRFSTFHSKSTHIQFSFTSVIPCTDVFWKGCLLMAL